MSTQDHKIFINAFIYPAHKRPKDLFDSVCSAVACTTTKTEYCCSFFSGFAKTVAMMLRLHVDHHIVNESVNNISPSILSISPSLQFSSFLSWSRYDFSALKPLLPRYLLCNTLLVLCSQRIYAQFMLWDHMTSRSFFVAKAFERETFKT